MSEIEDSTEPRHLVQVALAVNGDDPAHAARLFAEHVIRYGLDALTYNVTDRDTELDYLATFNHYALRDDVLAEMEDEDHHLIDPNGTVWLEPRMEGDSEHGPFADEGTAIEYLEYHTLPHSEWNIVDRVDAEPEPEEEDAPAVCTRCKETKLLHEGLCAECRADIQGVPA